MTVAARADRRGTVNGVGEPPDLQACASSAFAARPARKNDSTVHAAPMRRG